MSSGKQYGKLSGSFASLTERCRKAGSRRLIAVSLAVSVMAAFPAASGRTAETSTVRSQDIVRLIASGSAALDPDSPMSAKATAGQAARNDSANNMHDLRDASGTGAFVSFDAPGAVNGTIPTGINAQGAITGYYYDANGVGHGFVLGEYGGITTFDVPGDVDGTYPGAINQDGTITGDYLTAGFLNHGFVRASNGSFTTFEIPAGEVNDISPTSINQEGAITGFYFDLNFA